MTTSEAKDRIRELEDTDISGMEMEERFAVKDMILELKNEYGLLNTSECDEGNECLMCGS